MLSWGRIFQGFFRNNGWPVAITIAFAALMLFATIGIAVDFGNAHSTKTKLSNAADATALAVVRAGTDDETLSIGSLKSLGIDVAVVHLIYNYSESGTETGLALIEPFLDQIGPNLKACASPGLYFSGDQPEEIEAAMQKVWSAYKTSTLRPMH